MTKEWVETQIKNGNSYAGRYLDSEPVEFDGDIIITDPCYIISDHDYESNRDDWSGCQYGERLDLLGIKHYMSRDTLYGDWSCTTFDSDTGAKLGEFCADAGMVSVILLEDVLRYNPEFNYHTDKPWTTTLIKDFKGTVRFVVNEEKWTLDEDTSYGKKGDEFCDYSVVITGHGINKVTNKDINFKAVQTGL